MLDGSDLDKQLYVSFIDHDVTTKVRDTNATKVGQLTKITGQVVRTHPVHPELVSGKSYSDEVMSLFRLDNIRNIWS